MQKTQGADMTTVADSSSVDKRVSRLSEIAMALRLSVLKMIFIAQSGHPGGALSAADILAALYFDQMSLKPENPSWADRDRFILSKGHSCPIWYAALAHRGYFPLATLDTLRQLGSPLQGHPVKFKCLGIDATAGSLGIGFAQALGMALEAKMLGKEYFVYAVLGDGELQEGIVWETAQAAAKYKLERLVAIVDNNRLQNDGFTKDVMPVEPIEDKFRAFGWETTRMDGHDMRQILSTLEIARQHKGGPFCIVADTVKGKGVSFMENVRVWHGKPPDADQYEKAVKELGGKDA
jgi:transketolase